MSDINDKLAQLRSLLHDLAGAGGDIPALAREYTLQILPGSESPEDTLQALLKERGLSTLRTALRRHIADLPWGECNANQDLPTLLEEALYLCRKRSSERGVCVVARTRSRESDVWLKLAGFQRQLDQRAEHLVHEVQRIDPRAPSWHKAK